MGILRAMVTPVGALCRGFADLTWFAECAGCGERLQRPGFCDDCAFSITLRDGNRCTLCDVSVPGGGPAHRCGRCLSRPPDFDVARGVFDYAGPIGDAVRRAKYGRSPESMDQVARRLRQAICADSFGDLDAVVPVPLHPRRVRARGYCPPLVLAHAVSKALGVPLKRRGLRRIKDTPEQAGLNDRARRLNTRGAFQCTRDWRGKRLLLVDDVMTTGATFNAVALCLKKSGAIWVAAVAAASVDRSL